MGEVYRVAIHHENDCGYIEYDIDAKKIKVVLDDAAKRKAIEIYLSGRHVLRQALSLREFKESTAQAADSLAAFKLALTKLWVNTDVLVDWSRPVTVR
jgi:hypothetical protein